MTGLTDRRAVRCGPTALAALLTLVALGGPARRAGAAFYSITDLGNFAATTPTIVGGPGINASGQVVGYTGNIAFLASNAPMIGLGTLPGGSVSFGSGINDAGQVVGFSNTGAGPYDAFLYSNGTMTDLTTGPQHVGLGGFVTAPYSINNGGQIAGYASNANGDTHAFLYSGGTTIDLNNRPGAAVAGTSHGYALNGTGEVTGDMTVASGFKHAFLYSGGTMHDLGTIGNSSGTSVGYGINASDQVVGTSFINGSGIFHGFVSDGTTMADVTAGAAFANFDSQAYGINDSDQVVGTFGSASFGAHGFLYAAGLLTDLNTLIAPNSGFTITGAFAINDLGQVAAVGTDAQGLSHAILLSAPATAVAEPPALALLVCGGFVGLGMRRASRRAADSCLDLAPVPA